MSPRSTTTCDAPAFSSAATLSRLRVVAMVTSPRSRASDSVAIPTDDVPPRISRLCPGDAGPNAASDPDAVR